MSAVRGMKYNVTEEEKRWLLIYCRSTKADRDLIMECAMDADPGTAKMLFKSLTEKRSYERLGFVPRTKGDFYAYRRKLLANLKKKLIENGTLVIISGNIWSW